MQDLGYDSNNSLQILGSLFIFALIYFMRVIILYPFVLAVIKLFKVGSDYRKELKKSLFFGEIIVINLEAYMELIIAGFINYSFPLNSTDGEIFGLYVSWYAFITCLFIMPCANIWVLYQNLETIKSHQFHTNWGGFYEDIKTTSFGTIFYNSLFMIRRIIYCSICFFSSSYPGMQIIYMNLLNLACMIYLGYNKPFTSRFKNRLEIFNEFTVMTCTLHMMAFTDWVPDVDT